MCQFLEKARCIYDKLKTVHGCSASIWKSGWMGLYKELVVLDISSKQIRLTRITLKTEAAVMVEHAKMTHLSLME